jgi:ATP-binding cassette, subfamily G (WHITE), member 2, SNQ2
MSTINAVPLANQIQVPFISTRVVYEVRERPSRMYSWTALVTSQIIGELPFNIICSSMYFLVWYWTVGFPTDRGGFTYFMFGIVFPLYYTTVGQAVAAMAPNAEIAALLFSFLFSFVIMLYVPFSLVSGVEWPIICGFLATVFSSLSDNSGGGNGCIAFRPSRTW